MEVGELSLAVHALSDSVSSLASQIGVAIVNAQHQILWLNSRCAQLLGRTTAELRGKRFESITHPDDVDLDADLARRLFRGELDSYQMAKRYLRADGSTVWMLLTASLVRDASGKPLFGHAMIEPTSPRSAEQLGQDQIISQIQARMFS